MGRMKLQVQTATLTQQEIKEDSNSDSPQLKRRSSPADLAPLNRATQTLTLEISHAFALPIPQVPATYSSAANVGPKSILDQSPIELRG